MVNSEGHELQQQGGDARPACRRYPGRLHRQLGMPQQHRASLNSTQLTWHSAPTPSGV